MSTRLLVVGLCLAGLAPAGGPWLELTGPPELFQPGVVSTEYSEIRITFSPDGNRMLWGSTNRPGGPGGWDLWESIRRDGRWGPPAPADFNSPQNDFDPFFSPDGKGVYFFSNRPGGLGGDDIWLVPFDPVSGTYGPAVNPGSAINSPGDEWAPALSPDGRELLFASDGRGGQGMHDLFLSRRRGDRCETATVLAGAINSAADDFDAAFLPDGKTIIFTRRTGGQDGSDLYACRQQDGRYEEPVKPGPEINAAGGWNLGPFINYREPGWLYFTSHRPGQTSGRLDIYRIRFRAGD